MHEGAHHICALQFDYMHSRFDSVAKQMENRINNSSPVLLQRWLTRSCGLLQLLAPPALAFLHSSPLKVPFSFCSPAPSIPALLPFLRPVSRLNLIQVVFMQIFPSIPFFSQLFLPRGIIHRTAVVHVSTDLTNGAAVLYILYCNVLNPMPTFNMSNIHVFTSNSVEQNDGAPFMVF